MQSDHGGLIQAHILNLQIDDLLNPRGAVVQIDPISAISRSPLGVEGSGVDRRTLSSRQSGTAQPFSRTSYPGICDLLELKQVFG